MTRKPDNIKVIKQEEIARKGYFDLKLKSDMAFEDMMQKLYKYEVEKGLSNGNK